MNPRNWRFLHLVLMVGLLLGGFTLPALAQNNPVPLINQPLVPDAVAPGGLAFPLTVNGTGFVAGSVVNWNGSPRTTTFVSASQVTAAISAADIANTGTASVTIVNTPPGGGNSNAILLPITNPSSSVTMTLASSPPTGTTSESVAVGDFNGDGKLDLAVANRDSNTVSILLGDGTGNFTLSSSPGTGNEPYSVAVGDFNGDGKLDLAVANGCGNGPTCEGTGTVSILLGDGTGNFTLASSPATGYLPYSVAVGDFNGDGNLDLVTANGGNGNVSILLGDGTGNFTLASSPATVDPYFVAVGDFNGDGKLDLAVSSPVAGTVSILLGDGTGNFTPASSTATGGIPYSIAVSDLNGDGKLDVAVANDGTPGEVSILLGDGAGNFTLASSDGAGDEPNSLAVGDFNGDGKPDLAVTNITGDTVSILLGDGAGNFALSSSFFTGLAPESVAVGDFNGDGRLDVAVVNLDTPTVAVLVQSPAVTLVPGSLSFGNQPVGTSSAVQTIAITNTGSATLTIISISVTGASSGDFSEANTCGTSVAIGATCTISVIFSPMTAGNRIATITITDNAGGSPQEVPLTGIGTVPIVKLSAKSLTFGNQNVGTTSTPQNVTLTNTGAAPLVISGISASGDFAQTNTCGTTVAAGASCTISVTFTPTAPGKRTGSVSITDNAQGSPQTIALIGTGNAPAVALSPTSLTFGDQLLGTTSPAQTVTLTNTGTETLTITNIGISGAFSQTNTCGTTVAIGASCTISVKFRPTVINQQTGDVTITDNAFGSPKQMVPLTGAGTEVKFTPPGLTFLLQTVGTTSTVKTVTLTNTARTALTISSITIAGADPGDFSQTNTCPASLAAGRSCTISVTFTPTAAGTRTASVSVSDNGGGSPQTVPLSGTGTIIKLSATSLNFGNVMVGKISQPQIVVLTNVGSTTLTITGISVTGTDNGDFAASNTCHGSVAPGGSCNIIVRFIPTQTGLRSAAVSITDNGGGSPQKIALSGTGT